MNHISATACRRLWQAALYQQILVATAQEKCAPCSDMERARTRRWLMTPDALSVAALAGVDPDLFESWISKLALNHWTLY